MSLELFSRNADLSFVTKYFVQGRGGLLLMRDVRTSMRSGSRVRFGH
jgi:hypothetical protein